MQAFWLLVSMASAQEVWFYPGPGPERAVIAADSTVDGMPVRRTDGVLARVEAPQALALLPQVAEVELLPGGRQIVLLRVHSWADEVALSRELWARPDVRWAHPDLALQPTLHSLPDDPYVEDQWHLANTGQNEGTSGSDIDAETAWAISTGAGGLVAVIDTGVDTDHPDLRVTSGWDYIDDDKDSFPDPDYSGGPHGTCAAGVAAASGDNGVGVAGVAYDADIYAIRFIGGDTTLADLYQAFVEATDAGAWVLSNSWGFGDDCPSFDTYHSMQEALDYVEEEGRGGLGAAVVASAGNGGCDFSGDGFQAHPSVISVGALDGNDERVSYSCYGDLLDIAAPTSLLTTDLSGEEGYGEWDSDPDYYGYFSGTSGAAPVVSGVLALMFAANPRLSAADAREVLCQTAERVSTDEAQYDEEGWSPYYGCGRVDAGAAVLAVANEEPGEPEPIAPVSQAYPDRVLLRWQAAEDADGDWLSYELRWWVGDDPDDAIIEELEDTSLDITGLVAAGEKVSWWVKASDLWGAGLPSETSSFMVVEIPGEPELVVPRGETGCVAVGGRGVGWVGALAGLVLAGRRRRLSVLLRRRPAPDPRRAACPAAPPS